MKHIAWDDLKNDKLLLERGVAFEEVQTAFEENHVLAELKHHNRIRYPNQRLFVVEIDQYVYLVPYVEDEDRIFLKTVIPSRRATRQYLKGGKK